MSQKFVVAIALLACLPASVACAVTVTDNFDTSFDYLPGSVPGGGIWTRVLNPGAGGGLNMDPPVDPVPIFDANNTNAGSLTMSTFGVAFGAGGANSAPALVREVNADQLREVRLRISGQTMGQWSTAGILIRTASPIDTIAANDNQLGFYSYRPGPDNVPFAGSNSANLRNVVNGGGGQADVNVFPVTDADLQYLRVVHLGTGDFQVFTSGDGITWVPRHETIAIVNNGLAVGTLEVGLTGGSFAGSDIVGGANAAFDWIEIDEGPDTPEPLVGWAAAGSGDWNRSNWDIVGGKPDSNISVAVFGAGAPLTANATVYTNQNNTVKTLRFDNATFSYTVGGSGTLTLDADTGDALIDVVAGTHEIQADLILNDNTTATTAIGTILNINAPVYLNGNTFTVTPGGGTVNLNNGTFAGGGGGGSGSFVNEGNVAGLGGVDGDFSQSGSGSLAFELGAEPISVSGDAVLDGVLDVSVPDGFAPDGRYTVLTAGSVSDLGLSLGGDAAGMFRLIVGSGSVSLGAIPEPATLALFGLGISAASLIRPRRRTHCNVGRARMLNGAHKFGSLMVFFVALGGATAQAQVGTFRDDFGDDLNPHANEHHYETGAVPGGGIWTGIHNPTNGGGPFGGGTQSALFVADGFDNNPENLSPDKAGKLWIQEFRLHPNTNGDFGVGWEGNKNNAPMLYREIPADLNFTATMKIDRQRAGNWSYSPIIARLKAAPGGADNPVGLGVGDALDPTESFITMGSFKAGGTVETDPSSGNWGNLPAATMLTQNVVNLAEAEANPGGLNALPVWIRMEKNGGQFTSFWSTDGTNFTQATQFINASLNQAGTTLQVGPSYMQFTDPTQLQYGFTEIDFFEFVVTEPLIARNAYWRPQASLGGSGDYNLAANWQSIEVPGIAPIVDTITAHFADGDAVPSTGDVRVTGPVTVYNNAAIVIKGLDFNSAHKYSIGGSGKITLQGDGADPMVLPTIDVQQGSHEIDVDMALARNTTLTAAAGTRLDFNNEFDFGATARQLNVSGGGKVNFNSMINLTINGEVNVNSGGNVGGSGRINGTVRNNAGGTVSPGTSTGTLTIDGQYIQNAAATLAIELGGTAAGTFDRLLAPAVTLNLGTLSVSLVDGFVPLPSDTFVILDATNLTTNTRFGNTPVSGGPANTGVLTMPFGTFLVTYDYTTNDTVTLSNFMATGLAGDFNEDDKVDAADYVVWRKNGANPLPNDNGLTTAADRFNLWRANFGNMSPGGGSSTSQGSVPEPGSVLLALIALAGWLNQSRSRR
jgi:hypothetical protein